MKKIAKVTARTVAYWLICAGKQHDGGRGRGFIAPNEQHYHRADPYLVRCADCAQQEGLLK